MYKTGLVGDVLAGERRMNGEGEEGWMWPVYFRYFYEKSNNENC